MAKQAVRHGIHLPRRRTRARRSRASAGASAWIEWARQVPKVGEVILLVDPTFIPRAMDFIRGVIELGGRAVPLVDLPVKRGMKAMAATEQAELIALTVAFEGRTLPWGAVVDQVQDIAATAIEPPQSLGWASPSGDFTFEVDRLPSALLSRHRADSLGHRSVRAQGEWPDSAGRLHLAVGDPC